MTMKGISVERYTKMMMISIIVILLESLPGMFVELTDAVLLL